MQVVQTLDGSPTIYIAALEEHYHSVNGAFAESMHVFIENGLKEAQRKHSSINILEVGLGTGLNACLTFQNCRESEIEYIALEPFPIQESVLLQLNYSKWIPKNLFYKIHHAKWNEPVAISETFQLTKLQRQLEDFQTEGKFNLIYLDAFAPAVQPELWTADIFTKLFSATAPDGILVTYCAKGMVKRTLKTSGYAVKTLPGAPGKREMISAQRY